MKKKTLLLAGLATLAAAPLIAQEMAGHEGHGGMTREPMTRAEVQAQVKMHFAEMDANKDGAVTQAELDSARTAQMSKMQDEMFNKMDADKNGSISRAEFDTHHQQMMSGHMAPPPPGGPGSPPPPMADRGGKMKMHMGGMGGRMSGMGGMGGRMFAMADANKDGQVTEAEATQAALGHFDRIDTDKNGTINEAEHKAAREKMRADWKAKKTN
jgi:hypothetical protein